MYVLGTCTGLYTLAAPPTRLQLYGRRRPIESMRGVGGVPQPKWVVVYNLSS